MGEFTRIKAGQELAVKWRTAEAIVLENLKHLNLVPTMNGGYDATCHATFFDSAGLSVYLTRPLHLGGDIEAFLPANETRWAAYFEPLSAMAFDYVGKRHFTKIFPRQFV